MTIEIRPISLEDASFHREMTYVALWDPPDRERRPRSVLDNPKIKAYYENWGKPTDIGYIAEYDNKRVGFAACRIKESITEEYKEYPELGIAVLPEVQGIGIGDKLLSQLISEAKKHYKGLRLGVHPENSNAIRLYMKYGFEVYATPQGQYPQMRLNFSNDNLREQSTSL